jgi:hypothetical protein
MKNKSLKTPYSRIYISDKEVFARGRNDYMEKLILETLHYLLKNI